MQSEYSLCCCSQGKSCRNKRKRPPANSTPVSLSISASLGADWDASLVSRKIPELGQWQNGTVFKAHRNWVEVLGLHWMMKMYLKSKMGGIIISSRKITKQLCIFPFRALYTNTVSVWLQRTLSRVWFSTKVIAHTVFVQLLVSLSRCSPINLEHLQPTLAKPAVCTYDQPLPTLRSNVACSVCAEG